MRAADRTNAVARVRELVIYLIRTPGSRRGLYAVAVYDGCKSTFRFDGYLQRNFSSNSI